MSKHRRKRNARKQAKRARYFKYLFGRKLLHLLDARAKQKQLEQKPAFLELVKVASEQQDEPSAVEFARAHGGVS